MNIFYLTLGMVRRFPYCLLLLLSFSVFSQEIEIDSTLAVLQKNLASADNSQQKIKALTAIGEYQTEYNLKKADDYLTQAKELAESTNAKPTDIAYIYMKLGVVNRRKADYGEAISLYLKSKDIYEALQDTSNIAHAIHNIGMIYRYQRQDTTAVKYFAEAIQLKKQIKDSMSLAASYNMIGVSYRRQNMIDSALVNYSRARNIFEKLGSVEDVIGVKSNLAVVYSVSKQYEKSLPLKLANLAYYKGTGKKMSICVGYFAVSKDYSRLKQYDLAKKYADSSLQIALEEGFKERITDAYLRRSVTHRQMKNFEQAYQDYRKFKKYTDTIYGLQSAERIRELELQYQLEKERNEFEILSEQRKGKVVLYSILFVIALVLGGTIGYLIWRNYTARVRIVADKFEKEKLRKELLDEKVKVSEAELKFLVADNTMRLQFIQELSKKIREDRKSTTYKEVENYTKSLILHLEQQIAVESKFSLLQESIDEVNRGFHEKLMERYPDLTKTERDVCSLIRLNLSIKEISTIRNTSVSATKTIRHRIRKKLHISRDTELEKFIQSL